MDMRKFFKDLVQNLNADELDILNSIVYETGKERIIQEITAGKYPEISMDEKEWAACGSKVEAFMAYSRRTGVSLYIAKTMIEHFFGFI